MSYIFIARRTQKLVTSGCYINIINGLTPKVLLSSLSLGDTGKVCLTHKSSQSEKPLFVNYFLNKYLASLCSDINLLIRYQG